MAFIRKRGNAYYLVHNVRKKGHVRQLHLARLGRFYAQAIVDSGTQFDIEFRLQQMQCHHRQEKAHDRGEG